MKRFQSTLSTRLTTAASITLMTVVLSACGSDSNDDGEFIDPDSNGANGTSANGEMPTPTEIGDGVGDTVSDPCDGESANDGWTDNCTLQRDHPLGWDNSYYTVGVQRILFCLGINPGNVADINAFADGIFGPNTQAAIEEFQRRRDKTDPDSGDSTVLVDGIVGPQTWGELEDVLDLPQVFDDEYYVYSVNGVGCGTEAQFYQRGTAPFDWMMATTPGSSEMVPFSVMTPE